LVLSLSITLELWELLVICTNDLEDLLFEREELQRKESIKVLEKHLAWMEEEIQGRTVTCMNPRTREPIVIPGRVREEEQQIMDQISWHYTLWHETTKEVAGERKSSKEQIEKMTKILEMIRDTRDLTDGSVQNNMDGTLCANGVNRKVYHSHCLIGHQIMKLLANRVEIMSQLEMKFVHVQDENLVKDPTTDLALTEEIREEMDFFGCILHCYNCAVSLLRRTQTYINKRKELLGQSKS
jgi:hypothetical protein